MTDRGSHAGRDGDGRERDGREAGVETLDDQPTMADVDHTPGNRDMHEVWSRGRRKPTVSDAGETE